MGPEDHEALRQPRTLTIPAPGAGAGAGADADAGADARDAVTNGQGTKIDLDDPRTWDDIADELLDREFDTLQDALRAFKKKHHHAVDVRSLDDAIDAILENEKNGEGAKTGEKDKQGVAQEALAESFKVAVKWPSYAVVLTTYLYARYLKLWEDTSDWQGIRRLIEATKSALKSPKGDSPVDALKERDAEAAAIVRSVLDLIEAIDPAMEVESGLNCSCPVTMKDAAERVAAKAQGVLDRVGTGPHEGRARFVHAARLDRPPLFQCRGPSRRRGR